MSVLNSFINDSLVFCHNTYSHEGFQKYLSILYIIGEVVENMLK